VALFDNVLVLAELVVTPVTARTDTSVKKLWIILGPWQLSLLQYVSFLGSPSVYGDNVQGNGVLLITGRVGELMVLVIWFHMLCCKPVLLLQVSLRPCKRFEA